jgi:cytochrome bd ubiquinol oxidase subunit II
MCQGVVLGSLLQGIKIVDDRFAGDPFDWFSPFSVFCGFGVLITYATLACGWLILKTDGELQRKMRELMRPLTVVLFAAIVIVSLWTVLGLPAVEARWFASGNLGWFLPVPVLVVACVWGILRTVARNHEATPFLLTLAICFLGFTGLVISIWPNIVPPSLTIWEASSSHSSQLFALVGTVIVLPVILVYNAMQYRVFRGKVREGDPGYH